MADVQYHTHKAEKAVMDNLENYVNSETEPALYNLSVAIGQIAAALSDIGNRLEDIEKRLQRLS